jgi:DNA-binding NarL/FixJ family response regulator
MTVRVMIVDDQAPFRSAARMVVMLTPGFEIVGEAESGEEGVEMAASLGPDLVLMDVNMPGIDGLEATRQILTANPAVTVVVLSTYEPSEMEAKALEAGAKAYIPKAVFAPDKLVGVWGPAEA